MEHLYTRESWTDAQRERYLGYVKDGLDDCVKRGWYIMGREAKVLVPHEPAIVKLARIKGSLDFTGEFEGALPYAKHLKRVAQECWTDVQTMFHQECKLIIDGQTRRGWRLSRQWLLFGPPPDRTFLGYGVCSPEDAESRQPKRIAVKRGSTVLGVLVHVDEDFYLGELRSGPEKSLLFGERDGMAKAVRVPLQAHIAALEPGELGASVDSLARIRQRVDADISVDGVIAKHILESKDRFAKDDPHTLGVLARYDGIDYHQLTLELVRNAA